jgi:RNA polymerase sigma factor (sigma-70 family)
MDWREVERLYEAYGPSIYRRARTILRSEEEAAETLQDVFVKVLTKGDSFLHNSTAMTWLYSITTNHCLTRLRISKRRAELMTQYVSANTRDELPDVELPHVVQDMLRSLPAELAKVAVYYYYDNMTQEEISYCMGCSRRKVGDMLAKLLRLLAEQEKAQ